MTAGSHPVGAVEEPPDELPDEELSDDAPDEELAGELAGLAGAGVVPEDQVPVWALVSRAQEGDAEAFGELYDRYVTMVHRYVYHRVGDRALAEDVTSETFVRALRRIDSLSFQGRDVGAWLVTIARNLVLDHVKSSRYRLEVATADMRDADRATAGPEDAVVQRLTNEQLLACVRKLNAEQQECIALRFLQGLSVSETAAVMGKREGAIKALQHRAVRRLATLLPEGLR
jgi:RNA polymerase sigma-70 factor (ECF subfamily)